MRQKLFAVGAFILATGVGIALVEGFSSLLISIDAVFDEMRDTPKITHFDPDLGWTNAPDLAIDEVLAPGADLHTTPRGFRGRTAYPDAAPAGRARVLCSGDSFAFGQGVGDADTWCQRLQDLRPARDSVNLGVMGFGVDQSYLRYERDAAGFEHATHVFAFIGPDLARASRFDHHGLAKPMFELDGDTLRLVGTPVPETLPWVRRRLARVGKELRSVEVARRVLRKLLGRPKGDPHARVQAMGPMLHRLFAEIDALGRERGARTLFVYLPIHSEIEEDGPWRGFVRDSFAESGLAFLDLCDELRSLGTQDAWRLFIPVAAESGGHYNESGNAWAALHIDAALRRLEDGAS